MRPWRRKAEVMEHEEAEALPVTLHADPAPGRSGGAIVWPRYTGKMIR